ncbi:MAG: nucleotidyltransferase family protein [Nocardioidaceae bacterium]|nr:nucleotidyltransferase family protein [Nocardioidaceae bacterium]
MQPSPAATRHVRALARTALALESGTVAPEGPPPPPTTPQIVPELLFSVTRHRLVDLLDSHADDLRLPGELAGPLADLRASGRRLLMVQLLEIGRVQALLEAAGVPALVIKGLPLAVQTTGDPAARGPGDIDLLIPPDAVERVHALLLCGGWSPRPDAEVAPGTWAWRHVQRTTCALPYLGSASNIDLHWRLDTTRDALPGFEELWDRREVVDLDGIAVATLGRADLLAQTCFHAAKDRWRWLRSLVDVHRIAAMPALLDVPLRPLELRTLAITRAALGLPAGVPAGVLAQLDAVREAPVRRALADQERPALKSLATPGVESALNLRYLVTASHTPRDLARSVVATTLPVKMVAGVPSRTAWTGIPATLWRRLRRLRQRTFAWARGGSA